MKCRLYMYSETNAPLLLEIFDLIGSSERHEKNRAKEENMRELKRTHTPICALRHKTKKKGKMCRRAIKQNTRIK